METIREFIKNASVSQIKDWIDNILSGRQFNPNIPAGSVEDYEALQKAYDLVEAGVNQQKFVAAAVNLLNEKVSFQVRQEDAEIIYSLLNVISYSRKASLHRQFLETLIHKRVFVKILYKNLNLHSYLLSLYPNWMYHTSDKEDIEAGLDLLQKKSTTDLIAYVYTIPGTSLDFNEYFAAIGVLGRIERAGEPLALDFVKNALTDKIKTRENANVIRKAIAMYAVSPKSRYLFEWMRDNYEDFIVARSFNEPLMDSLRKWLYPWQFKITDPYLVLTSALLHSNTIPFVPEDIVKICQASFEIPQSMRNDYIQFVLRKLVERAFRDSNNFYAWTADEDLKYEYHPWKGSPNVSNDYFDVNDSVYVLQTHWKETVLRENQSQEASLNRLDMRDREIAELIDNVITETTEELRINR